MAYKIPKAVKAASYGDSHDSQKRHVGDGGASKKLKGAANKLRHSATHIKQRMKRYT